jgi:PAS domain S-box-containing protein
MEMDAPIFAPNSALQDDGGLASSINLEEIFEDCFAASEWAMLNDTLDDEATMQTEMPLTLQQAGGEDPVKDTPDSSTRFVTLREQKPVGEPTKIRPSGAPPRKRRRPAEAKSMTDQQRLERRERNREHAKRSRIRKKFLLESLLEQVESLRDENKSLRRAIRSHLPDKAHEVLEECITEESLLLSTNSAVHVMPKQQLMEPDFRLMMALQAAQQNFAVSDPSLPDNPIVYASQGFLQLTGYSMSQVVGRNCRFLQGPATDPKAVDRIRKCVADGIDASVCLLNYKADGTPFWNQFFVASLRDADGSIVNYVGVQCEVNEVPIEEIKERAKRMALLDI